jgi:hypothetical protein
MASPPEMASVATQATLKIVEKRASGTVFGPMRQAI